MRKKETGALHQDRERAKLVTGTSESWTSLVRKWKVYIVIDIALGAA